MGGTENDEIIANCEERRLDDWRDFDGSEFEIRYVDIEREPETECCICQHIIFEEDTVNTADGIAHESCAEQRWPVSQGDR